MFVYLRAQSGAQTSLTPNPLKDKTFSRVSEHINLLQTASWSKDVECSKTGEGVVRGARIMSWIPTL